MLFIKKLVNRILSFFGYILTKKKEKSSLQYFLEFQNYFLSRKILESERDPFLDYVFKKKSLSNASLFQDYFALYCNNEINDGYFVEFGAGNGIDFSNTLVLEKLGWNGLLIEPSSAFQECRENRSVKSLNFAVSSKSNEEVKLYETPDKNFSSLNPSLNSIEITALSITLSDALELVKAPKYINFLSIDTEGGEYEILKVFNFKKYFIKCIAVEHNFNVLKREKIYKLLIKNNFKRVYENQTLYDDWYINSGKQNLSYK